MKKIFLLSLLSITTVTTHAEAYYSVPSNSKMIGDRENGYFPAPILTSSEQANYLSLYNNLLLTKFGLAILNDQSELFKNMTRCNRIIEIRSQIDLIKKNPKYFSQVDVPYLEEDIKILRKNVGMNCNKVFELARPK